MGVSNFEELPTICLNVDRARTAVSWCVYLGVQWLL